jgi:DNA replication and repair protein RecF
MLVKNMKISQFRNYTELEFQPNSGINLIYGENGHGKTNLLEAISFGLSGRSFRTHDIEDLINKKHAEQNKLKNAVVKIVLNTHINIHNIETKIVEKRVSILLDKKRISRPESIERHPFVAFVPDHLSIIKGPPQNRRRWIDEMILSVRPGAVRDYQLFQKVLKSKQVLLKEIHEKKTSTADQRNVLLLLNEQLAIYGTKWTEIRLQFLSEIKPYLKDTENTLFGEKNVDISVEYLISKQSAIAWSANQVYDVLRSRLKELSSAEMASGQALVGPQKHDVVFTWQGHDSRNYCSQGQQRSIVVAGLLAHLQLIKQKKLSPPILLMDDIFSEFDETRQKRLLETVESSEAQVFMTLANLDATASITRKDVSFFHVENGEII